MIWLGVALVERFHFVLYLFGAFLLITGVRMVFGKQTDRIWRSRILRLCRKLLPVTQDFHGEHFTARVDGRLMLTPLALVLIVIDVMDLVFAVDSIPGVFAITRDTFIVYTSNICAILGLRSLYFLLGESDRPLRLSSLRPRHHPWLCRNQNDCVETLSHSQLSLASFHRGRAGRYHWDFCSRHQQSVPLTEVTLRLRRAGRACSINRRFWNCLVVQTLIQFRLV